VLELVWGGGGSPIFKLKKPVVAPLAGGLSQKKHDLLFPRSERDRKKSTLLPSLIKEESALWSCSGKEEGRGVGGRKVLIHYSRKKKGNWRRRRLDLSHKGGGKKERDLRGEEKGKMSNRKEEERSPIDWGKKKECRTQKRDLLFP